MPFIAEKEIKTVVDTQKKTPLGDNILEVHFTDDTSQIITEKVKNKIESSEASDASTVQGIKVGSLAHDILVLMREYNLELGEIDPLLKLIVESVNQNSERASNKLWNVDFPEQRTFLQIDEILKDDTNTSTPTE